MNILIDCRYYGSSGIGKYLEGIVDELNNDDNYTLLGSEEKLKKYSYNIINDENSPFSFKGLFITKKVNEFDLFFTPNFIIPFGIKIPIYSMIHDIIFLDEKYASNGFTDRLVKKYLLKRCAKKSEIIYTVSCFSKKRIEHFLKPKKIIIAYPALTKKIINAPISSVKKPYVLFVGNVKKNKGLDTLIDAFSLLSKKNEDLELKIVGEYKNFRTNDSSILKDDNPRISFTGYVSDEDLLNLIKEARFLIQPSRYEGFGVPPLEALYLGTKPIISDIEVFKEVYDGLDVEFFHVNDSASLAAKILESNPVVLTSRKEITSKYSYSFSCNTIITSIKESRKKDYEVIE